MPIGSWMTRLSSRRFMRRWGSGIRRAAVAGGAVRRPRWSCAFHNNGSDADGSTKRDPAGRISGCSDDLLRSASRFTCLVSASRSKSLCADDSRATGITTYLKNGFGQPSGTYRGFSDSSTNFRASTSHRLTFRRGDLAKALRRGLGHGHLQDHIVVVEGHVNEFQFGARMRSTLPVPYFG